MEPAAVLAGVPILEHPATTISRTIQIAITEAVQTAITDAVADLIPILRKANLVLIVARDTDFSAENAPPIPL
jgi:hypothetical protein